MAVHIEWAAKQLSFGRRVALGPGLDLRAAVGHDSEARLLHLQTWTLGLSAEGS